MLNKADRKEYLKAYYEAHRDELKAKRKAHYEAHKDEFRAYYQANRDEIRAKQKAYNKVHREEQNARVKAWQQEHKEEHKAYQKAYDKAHRDERNARVKAWKLEHKEEWNAYKKAYQKAYNKSDTNSLGQTKSSIRTKSSRYLFNVLKHTKLKGYEIHHCFGYDDYRNFIYIPKSLHLQIHQYLRNNCIDADTDHYNKIVHLINACEEYVYIKA